MTAPDYIQPHDTSAWERVKSSTKTVADYDAHAAQSSSKTTAPVGTPDNPSSEVFTLANLITFCRLILTICFLVLFVNHANRYIALIMYAIAASTDFLDGWVARSTQTVSWLGKIMDPIMDRFLLVTGVLGLMVRGELPVWVPCVLIGRDLWLTAGSIVLQHYRRRPVDVVFIGKVATALLLFGFCGLLLNYPIIDGLRIVRVSWLPGLNHIPAALGIYFVYAGVICSVITGIIYTKQGFEIFRAGREAEKAKKAAE